MSEESMLRAAFQSLLQGDTSERDRLINQIYRNRRGPEAGISTETDKTMAEQVNLLGKSFVTAMQTHCPEVFSGDARSTAVATLALAETMAGVLVSAGIHGDQKRITAITELFSKRLAESFAGISEKTAARMS